MKISVVPRKMNSQNMSISFVLHESPRHEVTSVNYAVLKSWAKYMRHLLLDIGQ